MNDIKDTAPEIEVKELDKKPPVQLSAIERVYCFNLNNLITSNNKL